MKAWTYTNDKIRNGQARRERLDEELLGISIVCGIIGWIMFWA